ncbi:hypothetical protein CC86DRAFT_252617, partial [Ophiobolus disseminans]
EEVTRYQRASRENKGKVMKLRSKVTGRDQKINELETDKGKLEQENYKLKARIDYLEDCLRRAPPTRQPRMPSLTPDPTPDIRDHNEYEHPEVPHDNKLYRNFKANIKYTNGTGKVWPSRYGSNGCWDLGLCQIHFATSSVCRYGSRCEFRHLPLTDDERTYVAKLEPLGSTFLKHSD